MVSSIDVAKLAGVSQTTVSRVLNNPDSVNNATLEKVNKAMEDLNYRPNSIARSLVSKKTGSIALISGPLHNPFFAETTTSIVNCAKGKGFNVSVHFEKPEDNLSVYKDVMNQQVDGIILSSILYEDPVYEKLQQLDVPVMMFNRRHKENGHFVELDNIKAGKSAAEHLIGLNHRDIVWMGGPLTMSTFKERLQGFKEALALENIYLGADSTIITDTSKASVLEAMKSLMARRKRPTAIFAATDSIAIYIMDFLISNGYDIPGDISIIGVDNVELSSHHSFQLSTVGTVRKADLGKIAIEYLMDLIDRKEWPADEFIQETLDTKLFNRLTTRAVSIEN